MLQEMHSIGCSECWFLPLRELLKLARTPLWARRRTQENTEAICGGGGVLESSSHSSAASWKQGALLVFTNNIEPLGPTENWL